MTEESPGVGVVGLKTVHVRVQGGYYLWEEAVLKSICSGLNAPVALT